MRKGSLGGDSSAEAGKAAEQREEDGYSSQDTVGAKVSGQLTGQVVLSVRTLVCHLPMEAALLKQHFWCLSLLSVSKRQPWLESEGESSPIEQEQGPEGPTAVPSEPCWDHWGWRVEESISLEYMKEALGSESGTPTANQAQLLLSPHQTQ